MFNIMLQYLCLTLSNKHFSDISFKKGDIIILKKKIDHNWCVGEVNGKEGAVPLNHLQVIVPLPYPQCKALYDFSMGPNEEEGCLTFKKGSLIHVLRRVDQNWAEGRIGDKIGIFPISFVEMNSLGKQLMDSALKQYNLAALYRLQTNNHFLQSSGERSQQSLCSSDAF